MFFSKHASCPCLGPWARESIGPVGNPETGERHHGGIAVEHIRFHFVERIDGGMVRVFLIRRILIEIDTRQAFHDERTRVGSKFDLVVHFQFPKRLQRYREFLHFGN